MTGALILHSAQTGTLYRCLSTGDRYGIISILVPQISTESSAVNPGSFYDVSRPIVESHIYEMSNRLKVGIYLLSGLTACILSNDPSGSIGIEKSSVEVLITITRTIKNIIFYLISAKGNNFMGFSTNESTRRNQRSTVSAKTDVKVALNVVPQFVTTISLIESKIKDLTNALHTNKSSAIHENDDWKYKFNELEELLAVDDTDDWHLLNDHNIAPISVEDQMSILYDTQKDLLKITGVIVSRAMIIGGGEASTLVWRGILGAIESASSFVNGLEGRGKVNLLCRTVATVLEFMLCTDGKSDGNPWKSIELCAATARLVDLVEEKQLLAVYDELSAHAKRRLTSDQIRLLFVLLKCLESGRENNGWCQLVLPNPPSRRGSQEENRDVQQLANNMDVIKDHQTLLNLLRDTNTFAIKSKFNRLNGDYEFDSWEDDTRDELNSILLPSQGTSSVIELSASLSSSKMLLPILQPAFRVVLNALDNISGNSVIIKNKEQVSLVSLLVPELRATITAALVGLAFSNARELSLNILSTLRTCIVSKDREGDKPVLSAYRLVFMTTVEEIRNRYTGERSKRDQASKHAYQFDTSGDATNKYPDNSHHEAANASEVEGLLLGDNLFQPLEQDTADLLIFPHDGGNEDSINGISKKNNMGWSNYRGEKFK